MKALRIVKNVKTGEVTEEEYTFVPTPVKTTEEVIAEKQAAFDARISSDPLIEYMFDELAALKGTSKEVEISQAKVKFK